MDVKVLHVLKFSVKIKVVSKVQHIIAQLKTITITLVRISFIQNTYGKWGSDAF